MTASMFGRAATAAFLLGMGACNSLIDINGDTALHWAAYKGNISSKLSQYLQLRWLSLASSEYPSLVGSHLVKKCASTMQPKKSASRFMEKSNFLATVLPVGRKNLELNTQISFRSSRADPTAHVLRRRLAKT